MGCFLCGDDPHSFVTRDEKGAKDRLPRRQCAQLEPVINRRAKHCYFGENVYFRFSPSESGRRRFSLNAT